MPLLPGDEDSVKRHNIREMVKAGHPVRVAVAAAMRKADESKGGGEGKPSPDFASDSGKK